MSLVSSLGALIDRLILPPLKPGEIHDVLSGESFPAHPSLSARIDPIIAVSPIMHNLIAAAPPAGLAGYWITLDTAGERVRYRIPAGDHPALLAELRRQSGAAAVTSLPDLTGLDDGR